MGNLLLEDIKRISSIMYGEKKLIFERFSKEIKNWFYDYNFVPGVFPWSGGYTNEFF